MRITEYAREKARQKIVNHIVNYGDSTNFKITNNIIRYWWVQLNNAIFGNTLDKNVSLKAVQFFYRENCYGLCGYHYINGISYIKIDSLVLPKRLGRVGFLTILVHEMVHQYQFEHDDVANHQDSFGEWTDVIKHKIGVSLTKEICVDEIWEDYEYIKSINEHQSNTIEQQAI